MSAASGGREVDDDEDDNEVVVAFSLFPVFVVQQRLVG